MLLIGMSNAKVILVYYGKMLPLNACIDPKMMFIVSERSGIYTDKKEL
jgi:hypothetical protein